MVVVRIYNPSGKQSNVTALADERGVLAGRQKRWALERENGIDNEDDSKNRSESKDIASTVACGPIPPRQIKAKGKRKEKEDARKQEGANKATTASSVGGPTELCFIARRQKEIWKNGKKERESSSEQQQRSKGKDATVSSESSGPTELFKKCTVENKSKDDQTCTMTEEVGEGHNRIEKNMAELQQNNRRKTRRRLFLSASQKLRVKEETEKATVGAVACSPGTDDAQRRLSNGDFAAEENSLHNTDSGFDQDATTNTNEGTRPSSWSPNFDENGIERYDVEEEDCDDLCFSATRVRTLSTVLGGSDSFTEQEDPLPARCRAYDYNNSNTPHSIRDIENTVTEVYELDKKRREQSLVKRQWCITLSCVIFVIAAVVAISVAVVISNNKEDFVNDVLPNYTRVSLQDPSTPQYMALDWLQSDPSFNSYTTSKKLARFALATLYFATNGQQWNNNTNWLSTEVNECEWHKTSTTTPDPSSTSTCQHLALTNNELNGTIPEEVGLLTFLRTLDISENPNLKGAIPSHLGLLSTIEVVDLQGNSLTGTLPTSLFTGLLHTKELHLQNNEFIGSIPAAIGQKLHQLVVQNVFDNYITGTLATEMGQLHSLERIDMSSNKISGSIPLNLWCNLTDLNFLSLRKNNLSGSLQEELEHLTSLNYLSLAYNHINLTMPTQIGMLKSLQWLDLSFNALTGALPSEVGSLDRMKDFKMSNNGIKGTIPSVFRTFIDLNSLDLSSNHITSSIPSEIGLLTNLQVLALHNNSLTGNIPSQVGLLNGANVRRFHVNDNSLTGNIPFELGLLSRLEYLDLHNNLLTGSLSSHLGRLRAMRSLSMHHNRLTGTLVSEIVLLTNMEYLLLNDNFIDGALPRQLGGLKSMRVMDLQNNKFTGSIPDFFGKLSGLEKLQLNGNQLIGTISTLFGQLKSLRSLCVYETWISGVVPSELCSLFELGHLSELVVGCNASISCHCNCTCR